LDEQVYAAFYGKKDHRLMAYHDVKKTIGEAYYMSEIRAAQELRYNPVPGPWQANIPSQTGDKNWAL
jgi:gluconate 2-dehydrogenase gamma chain